MPPHSLDDEQRITLCEVLDRVLNKGVVVHGDVTISVADVDLLYLGLRLLLTSIETAATSGALPENSRTLWRTNDGVN
jgi:predicted TIM-barrel enzyme